MLSRKMEKRVKMDIVKMYFVQFKNILCALSKRMMCESPILRLLFAVESMREALRKMRKFLVIFHTLEWEGGFG